MPRDAVFLDRDGTIIEEVNYLARPEQVKLLPRAADAIRRWNEAGVLVIVVTNQAGVARGYFPESSVGEVHARLDALLIACGARVNAYYYCPHGPDDGCVCRKPLAGMLITAAREHDIELSNACIIGDKLSDAAAGVAAGCRSILVRSGHELPDHVEGTEVVADLGVAFELWRAQSIRRFADQGIRGSLRAAQ